MLNAATKGAGAMAMTGIRLWAGAMAALALVPAPAAAQSRRIIAVQNDCPQPIEFFIHHADRPDGWHPHGWYRLDAGEGPVTFQDNGIALTQLTDHHLYIYARTTEGDPQSLEGPPGVEVRFGGAVFNARRLVTEIDDRGRTLARISC